MLLFCKQFPNVYLLDLREIRQPLGMITGPDPTLGVVRTRENDDPRLPVGEEEELVEGGEQELEEGRVGGGE